MKKESDLIESLMEDVLLAEDYGEDVIKVENGESEPYEFETAEDLFKLIK
ncbi:hypothetical protein ANABIO32_02840 [Rossellomorea marisflavi]|nr:hypothetical protein [Rossellomorea marisflavi]GLI82597.1 hypothetical protein ANABIO32_02840 [Rossellomorea marisflavi]